MTVESHLASVWEALADALGDDTALIHGTRSRSWSEAAIVTGGAQQEFSDAELVGCVRERLAGYKAPRVVTRLDSIPRTPNGKVDLALAREGLGRRHPTPRVITSGAARGVRHQVPRLHSWKRHHLGTLLRRKPYPNPRDLPP